MNRSNLFTRTESDRVETGVMYYDQHANMNFWDFGERLKCSTVNTLAQSYMKLEITDEKLLSILNQYDRIKYCHSIGEVIDLRKHGYPYHLVVSSHSIHMTSGVGNLVFDLIPEMNFTEEQAKYLFNDRPKQRNPLSILLDLKHPYRGELIKRIKEVKRNWELIELYQDLLPKDYYIQYDGFSHFEVFDVYDPKIGQRSGCSKKFRTLKDAIKFLWTVENNGSYWVTVKSTKDIPLPIKRKLRELVA